MTTNKNHNSPNVPNLRFPEFEGEWEAKTIDEIFELRNGYTPSKANQSFWNNGTIPWFRMEDIRLNGGVLYDAIQHITPEAVKGSGLFEPYSIILATTATIGEHAMIIADSLANQRFTNFKVRKSLSHRYDPYYLYYYFFRIDEWCLKNTNAGGLLSVDIPSLKRKAIYAPLLDEQTKIVKLLRLIDERIATQNKIIEDLKKLKSAISLKMLHSDSWEQFKIKDIASIGRGRVISSIEISQQENPLYPVYSSQTSNEGIMGYLDNFMFEGEYISWTTDGANAGTVFYRNGKFNCTNVCGLLKLRNGFDTHFVSLVLSEATKKYVSINLANPKLMNNTMGNIQIRLPKFEEQKRISIIFKKLQELLDVQKHLLCKYSKQKQYLLHQMFI